MRIVFMGSGSFACPILQALRNSPDELVAVVTQPDRPRGRSRQVAACPVKELLSGAGISVLTPEKIGSAVEELRSLAPDLIVVADYGQYIPSTVLAIPPRGAINVHPSMLPRYRGAAPIAWAIANGDTTTGVTVQYVAKKMDSGDILMQQSFDIRDEDTGATLEVRLAEAGAILLLGAVDLIRAGRAHATPQDESLATYARKLTKEDGRIDWSTPAQIIRNRVRGFHPWPGAFCRTRNGLLKIIQAKVENGSGKPGEILSIAGAGPVIATGAGALRLIEVQPEGRKPMNAFAYVNGARLAPGDTITA